LLPLLNVKDKKCLIFEPIENYTLNYKPRPSASLSD
jgi:hypothetical protein